MTDDEPLADTTGKWRRAIVRLPPPRAALAVSRRDGVPRLEKPSEVQALEKDLRNI